MDFYNDSKNFGKNEIAGLTLSPEEKAAYSILYTKAEPNNNGSISPNQAFNFLTKSKLSNKILSEIWQLTNTNSTLTREGFYKALKYIALAQNNQPINPHLLYATTPLPVFEGISLNVNANANVNFGQGQDINNLTISDLEYEKWSNLFLQSKPVNNNISGNVARDIFLKSGLPTNVLAEVWQLVDLEKSGVLDLNEFLIGMFIIMRLKDNTIQEIPRAIPSNLWKSVAYNKKSVNYRTAQRINSISSNNDNSFSNNFNSPVTLNRTGGNNTLPVNINVTGNNTIPLNVTGGSIPVNMTDGSININKTGGSVVSVNKTGGSIIGSSLNARNSMLMPSGNQNFNNFNNSSIMTNQTSNSSLGNTEYAISLQEREKYDQLFNKLDIMGNQFVTGEQSMDFFLKSGLSTPDLAQIWELADMNKVGRLTREEFYIAMHLIRQKKSGMKLPTTLPTCLIPLSLRKGSMSSIHSNITGNNSQLVPPLVGSFSNNQKISNDNNLISFDTPASKFNSTTSSNDNMGFGTLKSTGNTVENEINQLKNEIQQMDNSMINMTKEKESMKIQRDHLEDELKNLVSKKNELSMEQTKLKISYESETSMLNNLKNEFANTQAECNQLEEIVNKLKNEKMSIKFDIERSKEEITQLNNRIKELRAEYAVLNDEVERLTVEQKRQNDLLNETRQITMAEQQKVEQFKQEKMNLQKSIQNNQKELKELDRNAGRNSSTTTGRKDNKTVNPFEPEENANDIFGDPPKSKGNKNNFDDAFDALSARAATINSEKFEASFDDAFGTPATAGVQPTHTFDDAFQISSTKSAPPNENPNIFDDAFQITSKDKKGPASASIHTNNNVFENAFDQQAQNVPSNAFDDPFAEQAQNIPSNVFDDAFGTSSNDTSKNIEQNQNAFAKSFQSTDKNGSILEDPFASSVNLSTPIPATDGFDDAFTVSNDNKSKADSSNANTFDDDAFNNNNKSSFTNSNGFEDAFKSDTIANANAPEGFEVDFSNAFSNNNNDPFNNVQNSPTSAKNNQQSQDIAGFAFNKSDFNTQKDEQSNYSFNQPQQNFDSQKNDQAGFSFDNAFDAAATVATTNTAVITNDPFQVVSSPENIETIPNENLTKEEEEDDDDDDDDDDEIEEAENPFGDDQEIENDEDEEDNEQQQTTIPMPQPVSAPVISNEVISEIQNNQSQEQLEEVFVNNQPVQMPQPVAGPENAPQELLQGTSQQQFDSPVLTDQPEQIIQDQALPLTTIESSQEPVDIPMPLSKSKNDDIEQLHSNSQPQEFSVQNEQSSQPSSAIPQESIPVSTEIEHSQQSQPQDEIVQESNINEVLVSQEGSNFAENQFESKTNEFNDENAFNTDFNNAFQNMSITNGDNISQANVEATNNVNNIVETSEANTTGNMVKSLSNNSIKIDDFDFDKEFQDFENNPNEFDKVDATNETSDVAKNNDIDENVNSSFEDEFKQGFDENDFNFDTTFVNKNIQNDNVSINANGSINNSFMDPPANNVNAFDAFAEQSTTTAHFDTNFDDAFNFDNFSAPNKTGEQKPSDAFMDEAFGVNNAASTNDNIVNAFDNSAFDNNFNDFNGINEGEDPFTTFAQQATTSVNTAPTTPAIVPTTSSGDTNASINANDSPKN